MQLAGKFKLRDDVGSHWAGPRRGLVGPPYFWRNQYKSLSIVFRHQYQLSIMVQRGSAHKVIKVQIVLAFSNPCPLLVLGFRV